MEQLEQLQIQIKRDPTAYREDFELKWKEFLASIDVIKLSPHLYNAKAMSLLNFISHTVALYGPAESLNVDKIFFESSENGIKKPNPRETTTYEYLKEDCEDRKGRQLCMILINFVKAYRDCMDIDMRKNMINVTFMLRSRRQIDIFSILPKWLSLLDLGDRDLRSRLFVFIAKDLTIVSRKTKNTRVIKAIQRMFFDRLCSGSFQVQLLTCCICVEMYKRRLWTDSKTVNNIANCALSPNLKVALTGAHFLLGTHDSFDVLSSTLEDAETEDLHNADGHVLSRLTGIHAKKSEGRRNKLQRTLKMLKKRKKRLDHSQIRGFAAIDELNDPHAFSEKLFERCRSKDVTFNARLLFLHLISILIARHRLLLPNFYTFLLKYLNPKQKLVTKVLAISAQAIHSELPSEFVEPLLRQLMNQFVIEDRSHDVITVGINTIREIAQRAPTILDESTLAQIVEFRNMKNKAVAMAAKSLINLFRDVAPKALHPTLRGREAGTRLVKAKREKSAKSANVLTSSRILSQEDFENGALSGEEAEEIDGTEQHDEEQDTESCPDEESVESSSDVSEKEDEKEESDEESGILINPETLSFGSKRKHTTEEKRSHSAAERLEKKKKRQIARSKTGKPQSTTNRVKARSKPVLMAMRSKRVQNKRSQSAAEKMAALKRHLKCLKKGNLRNKKRRN